MSTVMFSLRVKAFGTGVRLRRVAVHGDGKVMVRIPCSSEYTEQHRLSLNALKRITGISRNRYAQGCYTVRDHLGRTRVGHADDEGRMVIDGCLGVPHQILSQPWEMHGGDNWTMKHGDLAATLADGTKVYYMPEGYEANGQIFRHESEAAMVLTPHTKANP